MARFPEPGFMRSLRARFARRCAILFLEMPFARRHRLRILDLLQEDALMSAAAVADKVGLSPTLLAADQEAGGRRHHPEAGGFVDRRKVNVPLTVFVSVKAPRHAMEWLEAFRRVITDIPEIVEAWRLTGETDYLLRLVVPDIETYDAVYQRLISRLEFSNLSSSLAMEEMKFTHRRAHQLTSRNRRSAGPAAIRLQVAGPGDQGLAIDFVRAGPRQVIHEFHPPGMLIGRAIGRAKALISA